MMLFPIFFQLSSLLKQTTPSWEIHWCFSTPRTWRLGIPPWKSKFRENHQNQRDVVAMLPCWGPKQTPAAKAVETSLQRWKKSASFQHLPWLENHQAKTIKSSHTRMFTSPISLEAQWNLGMLPRTWRCQLESGGLYVPWLKSASHIGNPYTAYRDLNQLINPYYPWFSISHL